MLCGMARIAIIGGGSIGEGLLSGLLRAGRQVKDLVVAERIPERAKYLADTYSVLVTSPSEAVENAAVVVVAVKPADVDSVMGELVRAASEAKDDSAEQVFVTVAAGITISYFESKLPAGTPVIRAMPNAAMLVGAGVTALAKGRFVTPEQLDDASTLFGAVGGVLTVPESQMDAVTALSGSGPAYFFLMVEALVDAGVGAGLSREVATELTAHTPAGSAAMLLDRLDRSAQPAEGDDEAPGARPDATAAQLRAMVTSPGGTTAAALRELERGGFRSAVDAAVQAAKTRSEQLRITSG
jgi:pyrroline-5-carboxylate reductase